MTYDLFGGEVEEFRAQDGGREEAQEDEAGNDGVANFGVSGEVMDGALLQVVEDLAHQCRAMDRALGDGVEDLLHVALQVGQIARYGRRVADASRVDLAGPLLQEHQVDGGPQSLVQILEPDQPHRLVHHLRDQRVPPEYRRRIPTLYSFYETILK